MKIIAFEVWNDHMWNIEKTSEQQFIFYVKSIWFFCEMVPKKHTKMKMRKWVAFAHVVARVLWVSAKK